MSSIEFPDYKQIGVVSHKIAWDKGWYPDPRSTSDYSELLHSELSEAYEEYRDNHPLTEIYYKGEKPEGVPIEIADFVIRFCDFCEFVKLDIMSGLKSVHEYYVEDGISFSCKEISMAFRAIRLSLDKAYLAWDKHPYPKYDICEHMRPEDTAKIGYDLYHSSAPAYKFGEVLYKTDRFCSNVGIDIVKAIQIKTEFNKTRPMRHGGKKV